MSAISATGSASAVIASADNPSWSLTQVARGCCGKRHWFRPALGVFSRISLIAIPFVLSQADSTCRIPNGTRPSLVDVRGGLLPPEPGLGGSTTTSAQPLVANEAQLSITHAPIITQGMAMNMAGVEQSISRDVGILDHNPLHYITLQAWSPFQAGSSPVSSSATRLSRAGRCDRPLGLACDVPAEAIATGVAHQTPGPCFRCCSAQPARSASPPQPRAKHRAEKGRVVHLYRAGGHPVP